MKTQGKPPFSYPVRVGHISQNPVEVQLKADDAERQALAKLWNVVSVEALSATLQIGRWKKDGVSVKGTVTAQLTQSCVVTLDPVESEINEPIEVIFVPEGSKLARVAVSESAEMILDPDGPDLPEVFTGDTIDVGESVAEHVALAIDPYPRKPGIAFSGHIEGTPETDGKPNPFAALKGWKKD